jgi:hypothetical protein
MDYLLELTLAPWDSLGHLKEPGNSWYRAWQGFRQLVPATLQPDILTHGAVPWWNGG